MLRILLGLKGEVDKNKTEGSQESLKFKWIDFIYSKKQNFIGQLIYLQYFQLVLIHFSPLNGLTSFFAFLS